MCGRITLSTPADIVAEFFGLADIVPLQPRYNIAPSQPLATVRVDIETGAAPVQLRWD
jgi:putative SOS response-associated peptidase YedK